MMSEESGNLQTAQESSEEISNEISKEISIEEAFAQIRELLAQMESEEVSLERSFDNYEKGMKLIRLCNEKIDAVEKKVQQLNADGSLQDFT